MPRKPRAIKLDTIGAGKFRRLRATITFDFQAYTYSARKQIGASLVKQAERFWRQAEKQLEKMGEATGQSAVELMQAAAYDLTCNASWSDKGLVNQPWREFNNYLEPAERTRRSLVSLLKSIGDNRKLDTIKHLGKSARDSKPWRLKVLFLELRFLGAPGKVPNIGVEESNRFSDETRKLLQAVQARQVEPKPAKAVATLARGADGRFVSKAVKTWQRQTWADVTKIKAKPKTWFGFKVKK